MDARTMPLEALISKLFIARPDVKAYQAGPGKYLGQYFTHITGSRENPVYLPWNKASITEHLAGQATYGHYLLSRENKAKLFAFDLDISKEASLPGLVMPDTEENLPAWLDSFSVRDGREAWQNRRDPARDYIKTSMRSLAGFIEHGIKNELGVPTAVAYTGCKGLHVYGFTGLMPAREVREAAMLVIDGLPIKPVRGKMIYQWDSGVHDQPRPDHEIFTIEVFPKQDELSSESGFGNLMRLPLGKNQKSKDPTFFIQTDESVPMNQLVPIDPVSKLRSVLEKIS